MNSKQLRQTFFDFFKSKEHKIVLSSPMVVKNDPTLMFTNAGMNQFKDIFLGHQKPLSKRVANTQKCLRVSGKHNDLEEVGRDTYHHTMFEMLGNWSFGDYFKKEAIEWSWEFLTRVLNIPPDRIYATVFEGNPEENVSRDNEAADVWEKCWDDTENRIINGSKKDNFWEMGDTGPCGPCSELHIDLRDDKERKTTSGHTLVNKDHPLVIEVWNLVFIQFNRKSDGSLEPLPEKHVDTGMGLERLCMVTQGKTSNYDTDVFQTIIQKISTLTGFKYGSLPENDIAMRVIADHLRAVSFSIADGQMPSNNKAGYVIRRILRRAIRYAYTYLSQSEPFIYKLLPSLIETMGASFPELEKQEEHIAQVILQEEKTFLNTLGKGIKLIEKRIELLKDSKLTVFSGVDAFTLYDTYGFPLDLTELILQESDMEVDLNEFNKEMDKQKARSKADASKEMDDWVVLNSDTSFQFTGYNTTEDNIKITRYRKVNIKGKTQFHLVFNRSPFYAESGGQVGDTGEISSVNGKVAIINTVKEHNLSVHITKSLPSSPEDEFKAAVNRSKRHHTTYNHSATHLLHHALRKVLGDHIEQKGSLVNHEKLRFDFNHFQKVTIEELDEIEKAVNNIIREDRQAEVFDDMPMKEAQEKGALALFGEKYGDKVRVISFGDSVELCGGTHVRSTGNIGLFKIVSEGAIAAGIRRIEAVTSSNAFDYLNSKLKLVEKIADILGVNSDFPETISRLMDENQSFRKEFQKVEAAAAAAIKAELMARSEYVNDILIVTGVIKASSVDMMKMVAQKARESGEILVFGIGAEIKGKANLVVMVSQELVEERKISAAEIIKEISSEISGGGGGQSFLATAGGKNSQGLESALQKLKDFVKQKY